MPEAWTGRLIGRMHNAGVKQIDLARELGFSKAYISQILNSDCAPPRAKAMLEEAFQKILAKEGLDEDDS